jgi:hypothetical protein
MTCGRPLIRQTLILCLTALVIACNGKEGGQDTIDEQDVVTDEVTADTDAPEDFSGEGEPPVVQAASLDLVFVVDNSGSMLEEQDLLRAALPGLIGALLDPPRDGTGDYLYPPVRDLHVGVINGDLGVAGYVVQTCEDNPEGGDGGALLNTPHGSACDASYPRYLSYEIGTEENPDPAEIQGLAEDFGCISVLGTDGCSFQQPLEALSRAMTVQAGPGGPNEGFLRDDSMLGVIFFSDDDDCSVEDTTFFDLSTFDYTPNLRCEREDDMLFGVDRYVAAFRALRGDASRLAFGMIVAVPPEESVCNGKGDELTGCLELPIMEKTENETETMLERSCTYPPGCSPPNPPDAGDCTATGFPPVRFVQLAQSMGDTVSVTSICSDDYTTALAAIIERLTGL